jgi:anthranilate/para-aminobenzoate synthase component I
MAHKTPVLFSIGIQRFLIQKFSRLVVLTSDTYNPGREPAIRFRSLAPGQDYEENLLFPFAYHSLFCLQQGTSSSGSPGPLKMIGEIYGILWDKRCESMMIPHHHTTHRLKGTRPMTNILDENDFTLQRQTNCVLLENTRHSENSTQSYLFLDPIHILQIHHASAFLPLLTEIQQWLQRGYYVAGYFSYECGYHIDKLNLPNYSTMTQPLAWFGVYREPHILHPETGVKIQPLQHRSQHIPHEECYTIGDISFDLEETEYLQKIQKIQEYIRAGDVYQINFTGRYRFAFDGSPLSLYTSLK